MWRLYICFIVLMLATAPASAAWWPWGKRDPASSPNVALMPAPKTPAYDPPGALSMPPPGVWVAPGQERNPDPRAKEIADKIKAQIQESITELMAMTNAANAKAAAQAADQAARQAAARQGGDARARAPQPKAKKNAKKPPANAATAAVPSPKAAAVPGNAPANRPAPVKQWQAIADQQKATAAPPPAAGPITPIIVRPLRPADQQRPPKAAPAAPTPAPAP